MISSGPRSPKLLGQPIVGGGEKVGHDFHGPYTLMFTSIRMTKMFTTRNAATIRQAGMK